MMKQYFYLLLCAAGVALTACNPHEPAPSGGNGGDNQTEVPAIQPLDKSGGCLNGAFAVAQGSYVYFSMGNLQYTYSDFPTWSFATNQYDIIGEANVDNGALADKIDLFGWSGSTGAAQWGVGVSEDYENGYSGSFADWGLNAISNGGNQSGLWRTLTYEEWNYLLNSRPEAAGKQGVASVNGVNGLVLLPDNWQQPAGVSFKSGFASDYNEVAYGSYQSYTAAEWQQMEEAGAVFLPAAGRRGGAHVSGVGGYGGYWSATGYKDFSARRFYFAPDGAVLDAVYRNFGYAVRLVRP